jgi:uncharacterized cupredoxin-like copper-binding protein
MHRHPSPMLKFRVHPQGNSWIDCGITRWSILAILLVLLMWFLPTPTALAANLAQQTPTTLQVTLGNGDNALKFIPNTLTFRAGKRYQLHLSNPSPQKHYFTAKDFADGIWSQKVDAGRVEIKGAIHELEIRPGAEADWVFVPVRAGNYPLRCTIAGHAEAGMTGTLVIQP